jgi:hypothetical protein
VGKWTLLPHDAPQAGELWRQLRKDGHVRVFTQLPEFSAICSDELGWELRCLVRESSPVVVPLIIRRRRGGRAVLAESLAYGLVGGPITDRPLVDNDTRSLAGALRRTALEVVVYPGHGDFVPLGWQRMDFSVHEVTVAEDSPARSQPTRACRSAARHAERCGVWIAPITAAEQVERVAEVHRRQQNARRARHYSGRWLMRIVTEMSGSVGLWGAFVGDRLLAAMLVGWCGGAATALLSTADPEARPLKAGNLLYLSVLESLAERSVKTVDLGGSRNLPALEAFKRSLGGMPVSRPYYRCRHIGLALYHMVVSPRSD